MIEEALYFFDENLLDEIKANYGIVSTESGADVSNYVNKGTALEHYTMYLWIPREACSQILLDIGGGQSKITTG